MSDTTRGEKSSAGSLKALKYVTQPRSASRDIVNDLMTRSKRFHCSVSGVAEYDVTDLRARLREERRGGRDISLTAVLAKATAKLIEEQPHLNRHQFTSWFGGRRIVEFQQIHCTLVVARRARGEGTTEDILLPLLISDVDKKSLADIEQEIRAARSTPLEELEQFRQLQRANRLPRLALSWFSFKARSDPDFYLRTFGTYGLSSLVRVGGHGIGGATLANTGVAFLPGTIRKLPRYVKNDVVAREILTFGLVFDHYLFDGIQMLRATERLGDLLEDPDSLLGKRADV